MQTIKYKITDHQQRKLSEQHYNIKKKPTAAAYGQKLSRRLRMIGQ